MKYKGIFYFFLMVFYSINAIGSEINIPKPLNKNDEKLYRKVFQLQTEGKFKESEKLIQNIENNIKDYVFPGYWGGGIVCYHSSKNRKNHEYFSI